MAQTIIIYETHEGREVVFPEHRMCRNWMFELTEANEAILAYSMAIVAEQNGVSKNEFRHMFAITLRSLKSNSVWAS